jgi:hypothetical protein
MGQWLFELAGNQQIRTIFLQPFVLRDTVPEQNLLPPENAQMTEYTLLLKTFAQEVSVRG